MVSIEQSLFSLSSGASPALSQASSRLAVLKRPEGTLSWIAIERRIDFREGGRASRETSSMLILREEEKKKKGGEKFKKRKRRTTNDDAHPETSSTSSGSSTSNLPLPSLSRRLAPGPLCLRPLPALRLRPRRHRPPLHRRLRLLDGLWHFRGSGRRPHWTQKSSPDLRPGLLAGVLHQALGELLGAAGRQAALRRGDLAALFRLRVVAGRGALPPRLRLGPAGWHLCQGGLHRQRARGHRRYGGFFCFFCFFLFFLFFFVLLGGYFEGKGEEKERSKKLTRLGKKNFLKKNFNYQPASSPTSLSRPSPWAPRPPSTPPPRS
jgi:hypothetical protein